MAYEVVVGDQLTQDLIDAGAGLASQLEKDGLNFNAALWLFTGESSVWRFVIASREVGTLGPKKVYERIQKSLSRMEIAIPLQNISVVEAGDPLIRLLKSVLTTNRAPGHFGRSRLRNSVVNGQLIEDALIYRNI